MKQNHADKTQRQQDDISMKKMAVFSALARLSRAEQHKALDRFMAVMRQMTTAKDKQ